MGYRVKFSIIEGAQEEEKLYVMDLLGKKIIQPSSSEWAAAPVICMKKDGTIVWIDLSSKSVKCDGTSHGSSVSV
jgi:hypothetical protein